MANKFASASAQVKEPKTDYVDYKVGGSKHCFSCEYFHKETSSCSGPHMEELSKRPKLPNGDVKVHPVAYCKFWEAK